MPAVANAEMWRGWSGESEIRLVPDWENQTARGSFYTSTRSVSPKPSQNAKAIWPVEFDKFASPTPHPKAINMPDWQAVIPMKTLDGKYTFDAAAVSAVPEPTSLALLLLGGLFAQSLSRRRLRWW